MKFQRYLTEALDTPYHFDFFSRNTEFGDTKLDRGKHGYSAEFKTESGIKYEVIGMRIGWTKEERERNAELERERKARMEADALAGKRKRIRMRKPLTGGIWEIHFNALSPEGKESNPDDWRDDITGTGNAFRVFATIMKFIQEIVDDKQPEHIALIAKTNDGNRAKLYETLVKRYAGKMGYAYVKTVKGNKKTRIEVKRK